MGHNEGSAPATRHPPSKSNLDQSIANNMHFSFGFSILAPARCPSTFTGARNANIHEATKYSLRGVPAKNAMLSTFTARRLKSDEMLPSAKYMKTKMRARSPSNRHIREMLPSCERPSTFATNQGRSVKCSPHEDKRKKMRELVPSTHKE